MSVTRNSMRNATCDPSEAAFELHAPSEANPGRTRKLEGGVHRYKGRLRRRLVYHRDVVTG